MKYQTRVLRHAMLVIGGLAIVAAAKPATAQANTTANASATIVPSITITKNADLQFGLIVAGPGGTVAVDTSGTRTVTGPTGLTNASFPVTNADFTVTGGANLNFTISLPSTVTINGPSDATMTVGTFVSSLGSVGTLDGSGNADLAVGATLTVGPTQAPGAYTGTFTVTVNYQ